MEPERAHYEALFADSHTPVGRLREELEMLAAHDEPDSEIAAELQLLKDLADQLPQTAEKANLPTILKVIRFTCTQGIMQSERSLTERTQAITAVNRIIEAYEETIGQPE